MARRKRGNFEFLSKYNYYLPSGTGWLVLMFWFLVGVIIGNLATVLFTAVAGNSLAMEYSIVISYPLMFIPAMIYASSKSRMNMMDKRGLKVDNDNFAPKGGFLCALLVMVGTLAMSFCSDALTELLPEMPERLKVIFENMTEGNIWINFLSVSIFAPIFEEWLCRGMVLRGLLGKGMKPLWAVILSAVFFAVIHANPWQAIPAFMIGCLFGYVYYRTGSLKLTMLMHFTNNTFSLIISNVTDLEAYDNWQAILPGSMYWVILAACIIIAVLVFKAFSEIVQKHENGNLEPVPPLFEER